MVNGFYQAIAGRLNHVDTNVLLFLWRPTNHKIGAILFSHSSRRTSFLDECFIASGNQFFYIGLLIRRRGQSFCINMSCWPFSSQYSVSQKVCRINLAFMRHHPSEEGYMNDRRPRQAIVRREKNPLTFELLTNVQERSEPRAVCYAR